MGFEMRRLGRTDIMVPSCCLGTMTWGTQNTQEEGFEQMDYALSRGINFWDTAEMYSVPPTAESYGKTETIIGHWFARTGRRQDVVLASKLSGLSTATYSRSGDIESTRHTKDQIDEAVENSLKRLQTDYIDLYQLHWPDRPVSLFGRAVRLKDYEREFEPFEAILDHLDSHVKAGRIRHVGLSNETAWGVMRFVAESNARDLPRVQSIQNVYNLLSRKFEDGLDEVALRENVGLLAYSPLAQGYLSGKYRGGALPEGSRKQLFDRLQRYETPGADPAMEAYFALAEAHGTSPTALALKFCDTRPFVTSTIIGATTMDQLKTCIDAFDLDWTEALEKGVAEIHQRSPSPCP